MFKAVSNLLLIFALTAGWVLAPFAAASTEVIAPQEDACCCCDHDAEAAVASDDCCEAPAESAPMDCAGDCGGTNCHCVAATALIILSPQASSLDLAPFTTTRERIENERVSSGRIHTIFHPPRA